MAGSFTFVYSTSVWILLARWSVLILRPPANYFLSRVLKVGRRKFSLLGEGLGRRRVCNPVLEIKLTFPANLWRKSLLRVESVLDLFLLMNEKY